MMLIGNKTATIEENGKHINVFDINRNLLFSSEDLDYVLPLAYKYVKGES